MSRPHPIPPFRERRRRRRGALSRLMTAPVPLEAVESRLLAGLDAALRWLEPAMLPAAILALTAAGALLWWGRVPSIAPRHRAEALCFALESPPAFAPPMQVDPGAALVRGRFAATTPAPLALREAMRFTDAMVIREHLYRVADYQV